MDRICITMPDDLRDFMIATGIVQDYSVRLAVGVQRKQRDPDYEVTFRMDERFKYFEPCLRVVRENVPIFDYTGWREQSRGDYDCYIDFDNQRSRDFTYAFHAHAAEGLGVLIGCGPLGVITGIDIPHWPTLDALQLYKTSNKKKKVLILMWNIEEARKFYGFIDVNYSDLHCYLQQDELIDPSHLISSVNEMDMVVGLAGPTTYAAASLGKSVIEIFKTKEDAVYYNSIGIRNYQCVYGETISAEYMWSVWQRLWENEHSLDMRLAAQ